MHATKNKDIRHLGLRITSELWERIKKSAHGLEMSRQEFCVEAIERMLTSLGRPAPPDEVNGKSVRAKLPELKSKKSSQGE